MKLVRALGHHECSRDYPGHSVPWVTDSAFVTCMKFKLFSHFYIFRSKQEVARVWLVFGKIQQPRTFLRLDSVSMILQRIGQARTINRLRHQWACPAL